MTIERSLRLMAGTLRAAIAGIGTLGEPILVSVHCVCRAEPVTVGLYQLVSRDVDAWQVRIEVERAGDARAGRTEIDCR